MQLLQIASGLLSSNYILTALRVLELKKIP